VVLTHFFKKLRVEIVNLEFIRLVCLNPVYALSAVIRALLRLMLKEKRFYGKGAQLYSKFLVFGVPLLKKKFEILNLSARLKILSPREKPAFLLEDVLIKRIYDRFPAPIENLIVVDVGAYVGVYTILKAQRNKLVIAFEPHPLNYSLLSHNLRINNIKNVIPFNVAVANYCGKTKLFVSNQSSAHSLVLQRSNRYIEVPCITLDKALSELDITHVGVIKIDAEGAELLILKGSKDTLNKTDRLVIAAYHFKDESRQVMNFLHRNGFYCNKLIVDGDPHVYAVKKSKNIPSHIKLEMKRTST
jgi:FkbM family methyltransferase